MRSIHTTRPRRGPRAAQALACRRLAQNAAHTGNLPTPWMVPPRPLGPAAPGTPPPPATAAPPQIIAYLVHWVACGFSAYARAWGFDDNFLVGTNPQLFASVCDQLTCARGGASGRMCAQCAPRAPQRRRPATPCAGAYWAPAISCPRPRSLTLVPLGAPPGRRRRALRVQPVLGGHHARGQRVERARSAPGRGAAPGGRAKGRADAMRGCAGRPACARRAADAGPSHVPEPPATCPLPVHLRLTPAPFPCAPHPVDLYTLSGPRDPAPTLLTPLLASVPAPHHRTRRTWTT